MGRREKPKSGAERKSGPANPARERRIAAPDVDYTHEVLKYLRSAHDKTRIDEKGDYFYANVSAVSLHFLLRTGLPARELLWQWYLHFDRDRSESIYQTLSPRQDETLLRILESCDFKWDVRAVRESGLVFLDHHRSLVFMMMSDFLSERLEAYRTMDDAELRGALTPGKTWSEHHLAKLVKQLQTQALRTGQRASIYEQLDGRYLKATARYLMDQAHTEAFWRDPPVEFEDFQAELIAFARQMTAEARRLGVYVSKGLFDHASGAEDWERQNWQSPGNGNGARAALKRNARESHFATLGLSGASSLYDVKTAYREMVKHHHPDQGGTVQDFLRLQEAYEYLLTEVF